MKFYGEDQFNEQNSQDYNNGYYQNQQQGYDNNYYQNQQQGYDNGYYQNQQQGYDNGYYQRPQPQKSRRYTGYEGVTAKNNVDEQPYNQPYSQQYNGQNYYQNSPVNNRGNINNGKKPLSKGKTKLVVIMVSLVLFSIVSRIDMFIGKMTFSLIAAGILFIIGSIVCFSDSKKKFEFVFFVLFLLLGVGIVIAGFFTLFDIPIIVSGNFMDALPYLIIGALFIGGLFMVVSVPVGNAMKKRRCTVEVDAVVIDRVCRRRSRTGQGSPLYHPVYEYRYNGVTYTSEDKKASNIKVPQVGDRMEAYVNPDNPNDVYVVWTGRDIYSVMGGIGLMATPLVVLLMMNGSI